MQIVVVILAFIIGMLIGAGLLWLYAEWLWQRNPHAFKWLVDRVIERRKKRNREP